VAQLLSLLGEAQLVAYSGQNVSRSVGFGDVVVSSGLKCLSLVVRLSRTDQANNGNILGQGMIFKVLAEGKTIHIRQGSIYQNQIWRLGVEQLQRCFTRGYRLHLKTYPVEPLAHKLNGFVIVIDDNDLSKGNDIFHVMLLT